MTDAGSILKPSEILDKAAKIIIYDGWHREGYYKEPEGGEAADDEEANRSAPCCQAGAISRAAFGVAWLAHHGFVPPELVAAHDMATKFVAAEVMARTDGRHRLAVSWNDEEGRMKIDIIVMLRSAAERARAAGD
jgi:hypothetical protein